MIYKIEKSCIGCKSSTHFIGALAYADDVILLCPSRSELQKMIIYVNNLAMISMLRLRVNVGQIKVKN